MKSIRGNDPEAETSAAILHPGRFAIAVSLAMGLSACATMYDGPSLLDETKVKAVDTRSRELMTGRLIAESKAINETQEELRKGLEQRKPVAVAAPAPTFNPLDAINVSLNVDRADVRQVFRAVADQAKLNLVLPSSLSSDPQTISLALKDRPASRVLDHILAVLDYSGSVDDGLLVISEYEERVFDLDFLQTSITAQFDAGGDVFGANQAIGGAQNGGDAAHTGIRNGFNVQGRNTNDMDPFEQIEGLLNTVLYGDKWSNDDIDSSGDRASAVRDDDGARFMLNHSTGTLYVRARPSQVNTVSRLVNRYKDVLGRQVLIEAQILDIELNDDFQYGIDWASLRNKSAVSLGTSSLNLGTVETLLPGGELVNRGLTIPAQNFGGAGRNSLSAVYGNERDSVAVNMLKAFGSVHVLSNPSLRVKNTQPAVVSVGRNERYISQTTSNVSNSGGGQSTVSANVVTDNLFDGVMLGVIPYITEDGDISLTINPVQTMILPGSTDLFNVGTEQSPQRISLPKVDFKGITTSLSLRDGDMVILGGLISENGNVGKSGVPVLADIPFFGELMGGFNNCKRARELVVVLRVMML